MILSSENAFSQSLGHLGVKCPCSQQGPFCLCAAAATAVIGALGYFKKTFATFWSIPVLIIYPLSIVMVWGLDRAGLK